MAGFPFPFLLRARADDWRTRAPPFTFEVPIPDVAHGRVVRKQSRASLIFSALGWTPV